MPLNLQSWKASLRSRLPGWKKRLDRAGTNSVYYFLAGTSLLPIVEAAHRGDWGSLALLGSALGGAVSGNLLANIVQKMRDKSEAEIAVELEQAVQSSPELQLAMDDLLGAVDALREAEFALAETDKVWFEKTIRDELKQLRSTLRYETTLIGDGAIAHGQAAKAVGKGGVMIEQIIEQHFHSYQGTSPDALRTAYLSHLYEDTTLLTLGGIDRKTASEAEARLNLTAVYTALRTSSRYSGLYETPITETPIEALDLSVRVFNSLKRTGINTVGDVLDLLEKDKELIFRSIRLFGEQSLDELGQQIRSKGYITNLGKVSGDPDSAVAKLNQYNRLVLLGDPGSGKSTFVNFVAHCLAGAGLGREPGIETLTAPLQIDEEDNEQGQILEHKPPSQPWEHGALLPLRIVLRDLASRGLPAPEKKVSAKHLWDFITAELRTWSLDEFSDLLRKHFLEDGGLLLLDGLDEVPDAERRRSQIKSMIDDFAASFQKVRILVTSRTYAYQKQDWRLKDFVEVTLAPFSRTQIQTFVNRWYAHVRLVRGLSEQDAKGLARILRRAIFASDQLMGLAERPILLTLMASLHAWRGGTLPDRREELYADAVDLLLDWWESQRVVRNAKGDVILIQPSLAEWLQIDRMKVRNLLNELAYKAHSVQPDVRGTADVAESDLVTGLMHLSQSQMVNPVRLIEFLTTRAGLLLPRGVAVYTFPHRTFQEYLAACYLTDHGYPDEVAHLAKEAPNRWREVLLLAAAKATRGGAFALWPLVDALCPRNFKQNARLSGQWGALLAGQSIVENANLSQLNRANLLKVKRVKSWLTNMLSASELPEIECAQVGRVLAKLGDPRREAMDAKAMSFCHVPAGVFTMGDEKKQRVHLPEYWIAGYLVTNAQFNQFVSAGGYRDGSLWREAKKAGYWKEGVFKGGFDREGREAPMDHGEPFNLDNHPVVGISWYEALAFARWLDLELREQAEAFLKNPPSDELEELWSGLASRKLHVSLPTEAEWEKAARGDDGRSYPWGNFYARKCANTSETQLGTTSAVGCFPQGKSPYGCLDMCGNVSEWVKGRSNRRGGSFSNASKSGRCGSRANASPENAFINAGFRVVVSSMPAPKIKRLP